MKRELRMARWARLCSEPKSQEQIKAFAFRMVWGDSVTERAMREIIIEAITKWEQQRNQL